MRQDSTHADGSVVLASGAVGSAGAGQADATTLLPRLPALGDRFTLRRPRVAVSLLAGRLALLALLVASLAIVAFSASGPSVLVPSSHLTFPGWEAGPLHGLFGRPLSNPNVLSIGLSVVIVAMLLAYAVALGAVRKLSMRTIVVAIVALHVILLLGAPLQLTDLFNYLGYARLGALHHLNPYTHVISQEQHDPIFRFTSWHDLRSPYGPLFTAFSYPLGLLPIPVAYWLLKVVTVLMSLSFVGLVWRCTKQLGRDPRFAVLFVAANPIYLIYAVGGFHNDFFMLVPSMAAVSLLLARRDRTAGAVLMLAVAVKFTAILLLPFLLLAAWPSRRQKQVLIGSTLAAIPLVALSLLLFGFSLPNLADQSRLLTDFSVPNLVGLGLGLGGGSPGLLRLANVVLVLSIALLLRKRGDWLSRAGWATVALVASLPWLMPWYVIWVLPLAALGTSIRLRRTAVALTVFLMLSFLPATWLFMYQQNINPMNTSVGQASVAAQHQLQQ